MTRDRFTLSPPIRMASSRGAGAVRASDEFMGMPSLHAVERDVEGVEVAEPAAGPIPHGTIEDERHALLRNSAMRAQRRTQAGEVMPGAAGADRGVASRDHDQIALAILRQPEGAAGGGAVEHLLHSGNG